MQLSEFTYIFLTLCIPFLIYIVRSTNPKKGFSILFVLIISANIFLIFNNFSQIGLFFLAFYLISYTRKEKFYYLGLAFISFTFSSLNIIGFNNIKNFVPILLISAVFSSMMIGHWFLVDPTINREGMKNIAKFSMYLSFILSLSVLARQAFDDVRFMILVLPRIGQNKFAGPCAQGVLDPVAIPFFCFLFSMSLGCAGLIEPRVQRTCTSKGPRP